MSDLIFPNGSSIATGGDGPGKYNSLPAPLCCQVGRITQLSNAELAAMPRTVGQIDPPPVVTVGALVRAAILVERERCAKIADQEAQVRDGGDDPAYNSCVDIAAAIRSGK